MEPERVNAWMTPPSETGFRDGLAVLRAYHRNDSEGLATVLENCNHLETLKAVISFYEVSVFVCGVDPCDLLDNIELENKADPSS
jgi:hypothetical protein